MANLRSDVNCRWATKKMFRTCDRRPRNWIFRIQSTSKISKERRKKREEGERVEPNRSVGARVRGFKIANAKIAIARKSFCSTLVAERRDCLRSAVRAPEFPASSQSSRPRLPGNFFASKFSL